MRIVHFAKFYPPEYGGIESITEALAEDHSAAGHKVTVVCFTHKPQDRKTKTAFQNPRILRQKTNFKGSQPLSVTYFLTAIREGRRADLVHVHAPNLLASFATLFLRRCTKVVVQWHGDIQKGWKNILVRPLENLMLSRADSIICTSQNYADGSPILRPFIDKISVIPLGIEEVVAHDFNPHANQRSRDFILFVGRLVPYKGLQYLLNAMPLVSSDLDLVIAGTGPLRQELEARTEELNLSNRVTFVGRCSEEELHSLFWNAKLFCLPSFDKREAFGVVLLEAMRMSVPVVTFDIKDSGVPWVNQDGITGIVVSEIKSSALAGAIEKLACDEQLRRRLSVGARQRFLAEFQRKKMCESFLESYTKIVKTDQKDRSNAPPDL